MYWNPIENQLDPQREWYELDEYRTNGGRFIGSFHSIESAQEEAEVNLFQRRGELNEPECTITYYADYGLQHEIETKCVKHLRWNSDTNQVEDA